MDLVSILPLVLLAVVFYLLIMRPARNRQKQQQQLIASVGPGTRIMTTAGFYGTISSRDGDDLTVVLAPGVEIRMIASAVARVIQDEELPASGTTPSDPPGGPSAGE
ncbi:MAG: preprotein translocase subunit YajC [Actinomycetales bacterium]|nr:preprotein translocase subunit YajC [Actinomycetales bacterium]